jgi:leader peptidase (prepilin peptidase)/N-methyltransferase
MIEYLLLQRCRSCQKRRKTRALDVMVVAIAGAYLLAIFPLDRIGFWMGLVLFLYFSVVVIIDIEHRIIMHPVSLAGAAICAIIGVWQHGWVSTLTGGSFGLGVMLAVYFAGIFFARWLARRKKVETDEEAFGFGDVALSGVLGLLLGWPGIAAGLLIAVLLGGAVSLVVIIYTLLTKQYRAFMAIPYGPFLIAGALILLIQAR